MTAMSEVDGVVMGLRHVACRMEGVQFHPEIGAHAGGPHLLANFLRLAGEGEAGRLDAAVGSFATRGMAEAGPTRAEPDGRRAGTDAPRSRPPAGGRPMSDVVRAALATVVDGGTLSPDEARAAMGAVMDGEATPAQLAALLVALRMRGETVDELAGLRAARCASGCSASRRRPARSTSCGTGGDGSGTFNISTTRRARRRGGRRPGRQARQPRDHLALGFGRRPRGARRPHRPRRRRRGARRSATDGFAFLFAAGLPPGDEARRPDAPRDRRPHGVQPARPADEPGRGARQVLGVGRRGRGAPDRRGRCGASGRSGRSSSTATGSTSCRSTAAACSTTSRPTGIERREIDAADARRCRRAPTSRARRWHARGERPRSSRRSSAASAGPRRDVVLLNAAAALVVAGGRAGDLAEGDRALATRRSTPAWRRRSSSALRAEAVAAD